MNILDIEPVAARWIARVVTPRDVKGLSLVAATLTVSGEVVAVYYGKDGYTVMSLSDDPDLFDIFQKEATYTDYDQAVSLFKKWVEEGNEIEIYPDWEFQNHYDEIWE